MQNVYRCSSMKLRHLSESRKAGKEKGQATAQIRVCVATKNSMFQQGLPGIVSRHSFLCRDMVLKSGTGPGLGVLDSGVCECYSGV